MEKLLCIFVINLLSILFNGGNCDCTKFPVIYEHDHLNGRCLELHRSEGGLKNLDFNDIASSVCVPSGFKVILYEHTNFEGNFLEIIGPYENLDLKRNKPDGKDWGDKISSVKFIELNKN